MPRNEDINATRKRLALVQVQRRQAVAQATRELPEYRHSDDEITARVEALSMAAATAALGAVARASHHDEPVPTEPIKSHWLRAVVGAIAALTGLGALAKAIASALK